MFPPPPDGPVERIAGPVRSAQPLMGRGQEEQVAALEPALAGRQAPLEGGDGFGVPTVAIEGDPQRVQVIAPGRDERDGAAGEGQPAPRVALADR